MAKDSKPKKRETSLHSRASRRAASPQPDLPKAKTETENEHWLYTTQNAGVQKKSKAKKLTRQQRERQLKAAEHADRNLSKLEKKVADSKQRARRIQARAKDWEELNGAILGAAEEKPKEKQSSKAGGSIEGAAVAGTNGTQAMEGVDLEPPVDSSKAEGGSTTTATPVPQQSVAEPSAAAGEEDLDEIL